MEKLNIKIDELALFWGDNILLTQLIVNLLDNAFKYSKSDSKIDLTATLHGQTVTNTTKICDKFEPDPFNPYYCRKCGVGISCHASITLL